MGRHTWADAAVWADAAALPNRSVRSPSAWAELCGFDTVRTIGETGFRNRPFLLKSCYVQCDRTDLSGVAFLLAQTGFRKLDSRERAKSRCRLVSFARKGNRREKWIFGRPKRTYPLGVPWCPVHSICPAMAFR